MAGQDIKKRLQPGQSQPVNVGGDFIFLKFADRPVSILINGGDSSGSRVTMEPGDKYRPGGFDSFEVENTDTDRPAQIIMTVGRGDYNRQIVKGEISIEPILRKADGSKKTDTRYDLTINLSPYSLVATSFKTGELMDSGKSSGVTAISTHEHFIVEGPNNTIWAAYFGNNNDYASLVFDAKTLEFLEERTDYKMRYQPGSVQGVFFDDFQEMHYVDDTGIIRRVIPGSDGTDFVEVARLGNTMESYGETTYDPENGWLFVSGKIDNGPAFALYDASLNLIKAVKIESTTNTQYQFNTFNKTVVSTFGSTVKEYDLDGKLIRATESDYKWYNGSNEQNWIVKRQAILNFQQAGSDLILNKRAAEDFITKPEFFAVRPGCEFTAALANFTVPQITADIKTEQTINGVRIQGEVIKAALEFYYKKQVPEDYLDHVYYFDASGEGVKAENAGNRTFAAANVADSWDVVTPGNLIIKIDNELKMGAFL